MFCHPCCDCVLCHTVLVFSCCHPERNHEVGLVAGWRQSGENVHAGFVVVAVGPLLQSYGGSHVDGLSWCCCEGFLLQCR